GRACEHGTPGTAARADERDMRRAKATGIQIPSRERVNAIVTAAAGRVYDWTGRHARLLVVLGLFAGVIHCTLDGHNLVTVEPAAVRWQIYGQKEDIHNLYFASAQARWRDIPHWF